MGSIVPPLSTNVALTLKTDYCGNMIYENGQLSKILTDVGYITLANSTPTYHYYLQDHLGNNRVVIDEHGQVEQVNHYYAFDGLMGESTDKGTQPYKYNGKELDRMHGLDWYDYSARHYDAVLGRWMCVDPLAEKYQAIGDYVYCAGNPIKLIDSDGRKIDIHYTDSKGEEHSIPYSVNMNNHVDNEFANSTIDALNQIYGYEHAKTVLDVLIKSEYSYDIVNETVNLENNMMQFSYSSNSKYINGGGKIKAAELLNKKFSDQWKSLAHELFHGYQRENKTSLTTVNAEVEAYTFQYMFGSWPLGNNSKEGNIYSNAIEKLSYGDDMKVNFQKAVSTFKLGSKANSKGVYNDHPIVNTETSLIFNIITNATKK